MTRRIRGAALAAARGDSSRGSDRCPRRHRRRDDRGWTVGRGGILLDEPCSALDPIATARIEELMQSLKESYTLVIVTHNMQQAARASDNTALLYPGELIEFGETESLFLNPKERQTEDYITGRFG